MKLKKIATNKLKPAKYNPRLDLQPKDKEYQDIKRSIEEFGYIDPLVINKDFAVIGGHQRLKVLKELNFSEIDCIVVDLPKSKEKALNIALNKISGDWDLPKLKDLIQEIDTGEFDINITGFDCVEIEDLITQLYEPDENEQDDQVPEVPEEPTTKKGDLYKLGEHRLLCGDATIIDDVERLMDGQKADMVFTDPPYNVDYSGRGQNNLGKIKNDAMSDNDFTQFLSDCFKSYFTVMKPLACIYVCHGDSKTEQKIAFELTFGESFFKSSTIIWVKQSAGMGWQDYRCQHEPILYGWKEGQGKHFFYGDRTKTTVWDIGRDSQTEYKHPTQKPVLLIAEAVLNSSKGEDVILDLFGGSGSTLIACEKLNRKCFMMELDEHYCDVIVKRWEDYTGKKAELI